MKLKKKMKALSKMPSLPPSNKDKLPLDRAQRIIATGEYPAERSIAQPDLFHLLSIPFLDVRVNKSVEALTIFGKALHRLDTGPTRAMTVIQVDSVVVKLYFYEVFTNFVSGNP